MPGITIDAQDQVYIFTRSRPTVQVYRTDGKFVRAWDMKDFAGAHFIRIGPAGDVWTANIESHTVRKYSPEGELLLTLGEPGRAGAERGHFDKPTDMAVLPSGEIFVSDGYGNRRIVHFDANGNYINEWGAEGDGPGQFALPHSIVADSRGRLYVADRENARIQVFDSKGKLLAVWALGTVADEGPGVVGLRLVLCKRRRNKPVERPSTAGPAAYEIEPGRRSSPARAAAKNNSPSGQAGGTRLGPRYRPGYERQSLSWRHPGLAGAEIPAKTIVLAMNVS
jgi:hypothetical protein